MYRGGDSTLSVVVLSQNIGGATFNPKPLIYTGASSLARQGVCHRAAATHRYKGCTVSYKLPLVFGLRCSTSCRLCAIAVVHSYDK